MDSLAEKLEEFGLENFIHEHRYMLCYRTLSPCQIASCLQFDFDSIAIIDHPPDNYSKCTKLYELIQKTSTPRNFLEALKETRNEHVINFMQSIVTEMGLLVKNMEAFGLKRFVNDNRLKLCKNTVNQSQVAAFLKFDANQIEIINNSLNNYSRNEKLYQLIEMSVAVKDFLEALRVTGNQHIINFIQSTDLLTSVQIPSTSANPNPNRGIWFNIPEPIDSFCGREDFLSQLHEKLQGGPGSTTEVTNFYSQTLTVISGLGGTGKTEIVKKYIWSHRESYNNFIWINAESDNSMTNSFTKLAHQLQIPVKNVEGEFREMDVIVKEIYNNICDGGKSSLIIFDNAEDYQSCKNFFPISLHPDLKKPVILVTSRNQKWTWHNGKLQVLPLDVLTDDESLEFILTQLEIEDSPEFREESREFIQSIGGLPLALQQAVAYIKNEQELQKFYGKSYHIDDYVLEFKSSMKKFQNFPSNPESSSTVYVTWNVTLEKIQNSEAGEVAINILEILSFLYADKIPLSFLRSLVPEIQGGELFEALKLLEKYSMIKVNDNNFSLNLHRQLQLVVLQSLKDSKEMSKVVTSLLEKCTVVLANLKLSEGNDILLNIHQIVNHSFNFIPVSESFLDFVSLFASVLSRASRFSECLHLCTKVHSATRELLGEHHQNTLVAQHEVALNLHQLGRYDESLSLYEDNLKQQEIHLGPDHPDTMATKHNIATVLRQQKKYKESLELLQQVLAQKEQIHGEYDPLTLTTQNLIALLHSDLGDFSRALALYQDVEKKQTEILGPDHQDVLPTKHNKACVLFKMGQFEEAARIFKEVYETKKDIFGENNLDTIRTLFWIAETLNKEQRIKEALELYIKVYEIRKADLGENHPDTIQAKNGILQAERKLRETVPVESSMMTELKSLKETETDSDDHDYDDVHVQELESAMQQCQPFSTPLTEPVSVSVLDPESEIRDKIESSLSFLCRNTVNVVKFAMYLLHFELIGKSRFRELMSLKDNDFTVSYFLYEEVLKLDSLSSLQNALVALNASGNEHILKSILSDKII